MTIDHKIQLNQVNLILRYVVQCADLSEIERAALSAFWRDDALSTAGMREGWSRSCFGVATKSAMGKIRSVLFRLGVESSRDLLVEFDETAPEPPEEPAVWTPRRKSGRKLALARMALLPKDGFGRTSIRGRDGL